MLTKAELQRLRSLREKKHREALGLFVVEGEKVVAELLAAKFPFAEIYATSMWPGEKTKLISEAEMARASHFPTPSSVLAIGKIVHAPLASDGLDRGLTLALDGVQDAGNVGTLLRIADWFGFDRVVLSTDCADLFHQKVINASMGSFARVRAHTANLAAALLIYGGVLERHPNLRIVLYHAGGALHSLIGRLDMGYRLVPECRDAIPRPPSTFDCSATGPDTGASRTAPSFR